MSEKYYFDFSMALKKMKEGQIISRTHESYNGLVIIKIFNSIVSCSESRASTIIHEWKPSSSELLAEDYYVVEDKKVI